MTSAPPTDGERFSRILDIMRQLRSPHGCPWDREQTHASLLPSFTEELYEFIEAVDDQNDSAMRDELGDLLLHIVFQAQIAAERGAFSISDVLECLAAKLIRRHPHVFGSAKFSSPAEVLHNWEQLKKQEHAHSTRSSLVDGIPRHLPALAKARKVQHRVQKVGFDWNNVDEALAKVDEELHELRTAIAAGNAPHITEELGDLLFAIVNVARFLNVEPERALHHTVEKFIRRFRQIEAELAAHGKSPQQSSLAEMDAIWNRIKHHEKSSRHSHSSSPRKTSSSAPEQ
ncbi:MAG: nucleoside triphosphate pyrophosphohydrolase [bacterium]|nr:nucleoside triphosphate pyrophosphohydrolase [bacterium]